MRFLDLSESANLGGHRLTLDDLFYLQNSILDVATAMGYTIGSGTDAALLSDLQVTDNGTTFTLGKPAAVFYGGKIWLISAESNVAKTTGGEYKLQLITEANPNNPVTYGSGAQINVHKNQYMRLVHTNLAGSDYVALSSVTGSAWRSYTPTVGDISYGGSGESFTVRYRLQGKTMFLSINLIGQLTNLSVPFFELPYDNKFKVNGARLLAGTTPAGSDGAENIVRVAWTAGDNQIRIGGTHGGLLAEGAVDIRDILIFEIE